MDTDNNIQNSIPKRALQLAVVAMLLLALPLGGLYFMNQGREFSRNAIAELGELGQLEMNFELITHKGATLKAEDLVGKVLIVNFLPESAVERQKVLQKLTWLQDAFRHKLLSRNDIMVLSHLPSDSLIDLKIIAENSEVKKYPLWTLVTGEPSLLETLATKQYNLPLENGETVSNNPYLALVDTKGKVRRFYNVFEEEDLARLLVQTALVLPSKNEKDVAVKREKEK